MSTTPVPPAAPAATSDSAFLRAARGEPVPHTPVWYMRQAGRSLPEYRAVREGVPMLESCMRPDLVVEITLQPVRRYGVDAAIFFSDIVLPLKAVGVDLDIKPGVGPVVADPVRTLADVEAIPDLTPYALDADVAAARFVLDRTVLRAGSPGDVLRSVDPARRLFALTSGVELAVIDEPTVAKAVDTAFLACSAQLLGAGERLLEEAVGYAKQRKQFGRVIGEYQALKHALADVRVALDFARPLVHVAALSLHAGSQDAGRDVSAAKVATGGAAYAAARTALQVHGAIGYTAEHDLGLWVTKARALLTAWGTPAQHRARVLDALMPVTELPEA